MPSTEWLLSLKVVDLKEECKKRGLPVGGKKAELVERLEAWIAENEKSPEGEAAAEQPAGEQKEEEQAGEQEQAAGAEEDDAAEEEVKEQGEQPAAEEPAAEEATAAEEAPAADEAPATAPEEAAAAAPMEAEAAAEPPAEAGAAGDAEQAAEAAGKADASPAQQQPAVMEEDQPAAAAQAPQQPAAGVDVDLDYGEDSEGEGAAAAAPQPAQQQRGKQVEEGAKRKRDEPEEQAAAAPRRMSGSRGPSADKALAAATAQGSAERPSKVPRSGSGFSLSNAEKGEAPAPEDVPEAAEPATRALRIDGFVRPFTERQVRDLLSETGQVLALWMPSIKTHAYCVFETKAQAEATRRATYQLQWPATNPKRLAPRFVPLTEAETAIGTGAGNPDFRLKRTEEDGEDEAAAAAEPAPAPAAAKEASEGSKEAAGPVVDRSKREWNRNRRSPSPPLEGVRDLREMLSRKPSAGRSADAAPEAAAVAAAGPSRGSEREGGMMPPGLGRAAERRSDPEPERRGSRGREEHPVRTLDELFRKTTAKPCIYWLPLTDEQVAEKKRKAAVAAEQQKQPAANGSAEKK